MSGLHVAKHVFVALDENLGVLLAVKQLLVAVSLDALQQVGDLGRLHFAQALLFVVEDRHHLLGVLFPLMLLLLVSQVLIVGGSIVVLGLECLKFGCTEVYHLLRSFVTTRTACEVLLKVVDFLKVFFLHPFNALIGSKFVVNHVLVPRARELLELSALQPFKLQNLLPLALLHPRDDPPVLVVLQLL